MMLTRAARDKDSTQSQSVVDEPPCHAVDMNAAAASGGARSARRQAGPLEAPAEAATGESGGAATTVAGGAGEGDSGVELSPSRGGDGGGEVGD